MKRIIITLGALALAAGLSLGLVGGPAGTASASTVSVVYRGLGDRVPHVRPGYVTTSMSGPSAWNLHWSRWNARSARATGTLIVNDCVPYCAQGTISRYKLVVTLSGVKYHNGRRYFSVMGWHVPGYVLRQHFIRGTGRWVRTTYLHFARGYWS